MLAAERHSRLTALLAQRGMSPVETLAAELGVSASTIRRDLDGLEQQGLVRRTHGGVIWTADRNAASPARPYAFDQRIDVQADAKRRIAKLARSLISTGETVLLDGGTTTYYLAQELSGLSLQLVTNSLPIASLFQSDDSVELIMTGGLVYPRYGVLLGPMAEHVLSMIHTRTMFLSVAGLHEGSLYNQNLLLVEAERRMMAQAQQTVLLIDSTKFGQQALARLGPLSDVDIVVTDSGASEADLAQVRAAGCELMIA